MESKGGRRGGREEGEGDVEKDTRGERIQHQ